MIELTEQQRAELARRQPVEVRDPGTNEVYVLLPKDVYERVRQISPGLEVLPTPAWPFSINGAALVPQAFRPMLMP